MSHFSGFLDVVYLLRRMTWSRLRIHDLRSMTWTWTKHDKTLWLGWLGLGDTLTLYPLCEPWCWYLYLHLGDFVRANVGPYSIDGAYGYCNIPVLQCLYVSLIHGCWRLFHQRTMTRNAARMRWGQQSLKQSFRMLHVCLIRHCERLDHVSTSRKLQMTPESSSTTPSR